MQATSCVTISQMSLFLGMETTKIDALFVVRNRCLPTPIGIFHPRNTPNTLQAMLVIIFAVCPILAVRSFAKIFKTVVSSVSVDMVNLTDRMVSRYVVPNQPVGSIMFPINFKIYISFMVQISRFLTDSYFWPRDVPEQEPGDGVISKKAGEFRMADHSVILPGYETDCKTEGDLNV